MPETLHLKYLDGAALIEAFFTHWTLREAFAEAKGIGISYPTRKLHFDIVDDHTIRVRCEWTSLPNTVSCNTTLRARGCLIQE